MFWRFEIEVEFENEKKKSLKWGGRFMITHLRLEAVVLTEIKENEQDTVEFIDFD